MRIRIAGLLAVGLLAACGASTTGNRPASTPAPTSPSVSSSSALPQQCQSPDGKALTKSEAATCYSILASYTGAKLPDVTNAFTSGPVDLANAKHLAQVAHDGLTQTVSGLRAAQWPVDVAPLCARLADKEERFAQQMTRIVQAANVKDAEAAFHEFERIRGPVQPDHLDPIGKQIRIKLGLLPPDS